jgi:hypothetical protein
MKLYLQPFTLEEIVEYTRSVFDLAAETSATVAAWLQEKTLGHPYFLAFVCKHLSATMSRIVPAALERMWPAILGQLGRERFCQDLSRLSAKELDLIHQFANLGDGEFTTRHFTGKFQREYFARLVEKGLLIRTRRGRYRLYNRLFREFLQQSK